MAVWGAPTHVVQYLGLAGAIGLLIAALMSAFSPKWGRKVAIDLMTRAGVTGRINSNGRSGEISQRKLIFLVAGQISAPYNAHFPRGGTQVHAFDGKRWLAIPPDAREFPLFVTLKPEGRWTMCQEKMEYGTQGHAAYGW